MDAPADPRADFRARVPFIDLMGFELRTFEGGHAEVVFEPRPEHKNHLGHTHGGAIMTLMDVAMGTAARSVEPGAGVVTIELKTTFMRAANGVLVGKGRLMHRTGKMAFVEATIVDADGRACAHGTGTFKYTRHTAPAA